MQILFHVWDYVFKKIISLVIIRLTGYFFFIQDSIDPLYNSKSKNKLKKNLQLCKVFFKT